MGVGPKSKVKLYGSALVVIYEIFGLCGSVSQTFMKHTDSDLQFSGSQTFKVTMRTAWCKIKHKKARSDQDRVPYAYTHFKSCFL